MSRLLSWRFLSVLFVPLAASAYVAWGAERGSFFLLASIAAGVLSLQENERP